MIAGWERVAVVGPSGAGKTTLARTLGERLGAPHIELDTLQFLPGWRSRPLADFRTRVDEATRGDRWVADGNWSPVRDLVWGRATTLVWMDYPLAGCFLRVVQRSVVRAWRGERVCGDNRETFRQTFASRESVVLWLLRTHALRRRENAAALAEGGWDFQRVVRLRSHREGESLIASLTDV